MASEEMKVITRTFDFLTWLLPTTNNFPRAHRHSTAAAAYSIDGAKVNCDPAGSAGRS